MIPISQIKKNLEYSQDLTEIITALKLIASSQFSNLFSKVPKEDVLKKYIISCFDILAAISKTNPFFVEKKDIPKAFLMLCSDEGFLGEVNNNIVDAALARGLKENARFIMIGQRGARILKDSEVEFRPFPTMGGDISVEYIINISNYIMDLYKKGEISAVHIIYMKFRSFTSHKIDVVKLLPCDEFLTYLKKEEAEDVLETLIEPSLYYVVEYLIKLWLENNLYHIFWSSKLSEWSIRAMHLEHSSDELKEINKDLKFKYFKSVHALNDKVIREIFAARRVA